MRTVVVRECMRIPIGRQGENEAARVVWPDVAEAWAKLYGQGTFQLAARRKGDAAPYPVPVTVDGGDVVWVVTSSDTAVPGDGSCELSYLVGDAVAKSRTWGTQVSVSLTGDEPTDPPEPEASWVAKVLAAGTAAGEGAAQAAASAKQAETAAKESASSAQAAAASAEQAETAAKESAESAQAAAALASHAPYVDAETGNWFVWDAEKCEFTDTGVPATGPAGKDAPQIDDGTISTKAPWSSQKIVETLCPPFEVNGNPAVCYPVAGSPLDVVASWDPTQEGEGDPSPDNIRPIVSRRNVQLEWCGDNILKISSLTNYLTGPVTVTEENGWITIDGAPTSGNVYLTRNLLLRAGTYVFRLFGGDEIGGGLSNVWVYGGAVAQSLTYQTPVIVATVGEDSVVSVYFHHAKNKTYDSERFSVSITPGSTPPGEFTEYHGVTKTLSLPKSTPGGAVDLVTGAGQQSWEVIDSYAGETLPGEWLSDRDIYATGAAPTVGAQVVYKLPEPTPFRASGNAPFSALAGMNTFQTDADAVSVKGLADPIHILQQLSAGAATQAAENRMLQQKVVALTDQNDFHEELIVELANEVYE